MAQNTIKTKNLGELIEFLKEEIPKKRRFSSIFILTKSFKTLKEILEYLNIHTKIIKLHNFCQDNDLTPLFSFEDVKCKAKSSKIPLSITSLCAWWRLGLSNPTPEETIKQLACFENPNATRIIIPIYDPYKDIYKIWFQHSRAKQDEFSIFAEIDESDLLVETYIAEPIEKISLSDFYIINGIKEYLRFFSSPKVVKRILLLTKANKYVIKKPLIKPLKSFLDLLLIFFPDLKNMPFKDNNFVKEILLSLDFNRDKNFSSFVERIVGYPLEEKNIVKNWRNHSSFQKKLLILWASNQETDNKFISLLASSGLESNSLTEQIYFSDLDPVIRKNFLSYLTPYKLFDLPDNPLEKLKLLTDLTVSEEKELLKCLKKYLNKIDIDDIFKILKINAPFLFYYLNPKTKIDDNNYFYFYRLAKLGKQIKKWPKVNLQSFPARKEILSKLQCSSNLEIWIDGLGIEWIGIFDNYFQEKGWKVDVFVGRANIPTITEVNKPTYEVHYYYDLDQVAHQYNASIEEQILKELNTIKELIKRIEEKLLQTDDIVVTGDHGLTWSSFHKEKIVLPKGALHPLRSGRVAIVEELTTDILDSNAWQVSRDDKYICLTKHGYFSGAKKSSGLEFHGGALPEEVLVPIIHIYRTKDLEFSFEVLKTKIELTQGRNPIIRIKIHPITSENVSLKILDKYIPLKRKEEIYYAELKDINPGKHKIELFIQDKKIGSSMIEILSPLLEEEDMGI